MQKMSQTTVQQQLPSVNEIRTQPNETYNLKVAIYFWVSTWYKLSHLSVVVGGV